MDLIELTQKLISIPSFVDNKTDEKEIGNFIYNYLKEFTSLEVIKQKVENDRFNIIAKDNYPTKLLITCHMDTVEPKSEWEYSPFEEKVKDNKLYGLGSCDMKGGTACVLSAVKGMSTKGLTLLFYCDEEYDFKGMKEFLKEFSFSPKLILSPENTQLEIVSGCKGIIEIFFRIKGKSGHPAKPEEGKNSIEGIMNIINAVKKGVDKYQDPLLGKSLLNVGYMLGGLMKSLDNQGNIVVGNRGNNIPDIAEATLDIRTADPKLNAETISEIIQKEIKGLKLEKMEVRSNFKPMCSSKESFKELEQSIIKENLCPNYGDMKKQAYFDGGMMANKLSAPFACFGPIGRNAHGAEEWVDIKSLEKTRNVYKNLIQKFCT